MVVKKAYPGTISSVILSVIVMIMLLLPFYVANNRDRLRVGEGGIEFKEVMCFDINDKSYFQSDNFHIYKPPLIPQYGGAGAGRIDYYSSVGANSIMHFPMNLGTTPRDGTVDGYGVGSVAYVPGYPPFTPCENAPFYPYMHVYTSLTKSDIIERDITRMDIYYELENVASYVGGIIFLSIEDDWVSTPPYRFWILIKDIENVEYSAVTQVEITVDDLLKINSMPDEYTLGFYFYSTEIEPCPILEGANFYFDMQFYCIEEIKIPTVDYMGIAMIGGGIFMSFCAILMLPHITFRSVIGLIVGKGGK